MIEKNHVKYVLLLPFLFGGCMSSPQPLTPEIRSELRGTIHDEEQGELAIGQSVWRYKDGRFLVYGGDTETDKIYYFFFSEQRWGSVDVEDYAPYKPASFSGELKIQFNNEEQIIPFGISTKLVHLNSEGNISVANAKLQMDQWRNIMQPYANSTKNSDFDEILEKLWALPRTTE